MADMNVVRQLAADYARLVDDFDLAGFEGILTPDFHQRGEGFESRSREEFIAALEALRHYDRTFHLVGQSCGQWQGERYEGETWSVASHLYRVDGVQRKMDMGVRYQELIVRSEGRWKYAHRHLDVVWSGDLPTRL